MKIFNKIKREKVGLTPAETIQVEFEMACQDVRISAYEILHKSQSEYIEKVDKIVDEDTLTIIELREKVSLLNKANNLLQNVASHYEILNGLLVQEGGTHGLN